MKFENLKLRMEKIDMNEKQELRRQGILKYSDPMRERWDYFVMILSIYNSGYLPYEQAFEKYEHCSFSNLSGIDYFNYSIDICFGIDIIINFSTTFVDPETGEERKTRKEIIQNYIMGMFLIDFMATVPFYELFCVILQGNMSRWVQMLAVLKLIRVLRLQRVITYMNTTDDVKLTLQLVKTSIYLVLFIHFTACLWFYFAAGDEKWIPGQTKLFGEMGANLYTDFTPFGQLTICLYTSVLALCGNDIYPISNNQYILSSVILVLGALFNAYMFGTIAVIFQTLNKKSQKFIEQLDIANTSMKNMHLPSEIQELVREYLLRTQSNLDQQRELEEFLGIISPSLVQKVTQQVFMNSIKNNQIFAERTDVTKYMVQQVSPQLALPEMSIIFKNDLPDNVYFIAQGQCDVTLLDHMKNTRVIRTLDQGELFGECALIFSCHRTATVKSQNYSTLAFLSQKDFLELWDYSPDTFYLIREKALSYNDPWIQFKIKLLEQVEYFKPYKDKQGFLTQIQFYMQDFMYQKDHVILDFDQNCNKIFFIVNGCVDLEIIDNSGSLRVLETLEQGDFIGQFSVLFHTKLIFRIVAKTTSTRVLTLGDDFFVEYADKDSIQGLSEAIQLAEDFEEEWGLPTCDFHKYPVENINMRMTTKQSLDMKLRILKQRLILISKLNKYQRQLFDVQINCAMDKAIPHEEFMREFREREDIRKAKEEYERHVKQNQYVNSEEYSEEDNGYGDEDIVSQDLDESSEGSNKQIFLSRQSSSQNYILSSMNMQSNQDERGEKMTPMMDQIVSDKQKSELMPLQRHLTTHIEKDDFQRSFSRKKTKKLSRENTPQHSPKRMKQNSPTRQQQSQSKKGQIINNTAKQIRLIESPEVSASRPSSQGRINNTLSLPSSINAGAPLQSAITEEASNEDLISNSNTRRQILKAQKVISSRSSITHKSSSSLDIKLIEQELQSKKLQNRVEVDNQPLFKKQKTKKRVAVIEEENEELDEEVSQEGEYGSSLDGDENEEDQYDVEDVDEDEEEDDDQNQIIELPKKKKDMKSQKVQRNKKVNQDDDLSSQEDLEASRDNHQSIINDEDQDELDDEPDVEEEDSDEEEVEDDEEDDGEEEQDDSNAENEDEEQEDEEEEDDVEEEEAEDEQSPEEEEPPVQQKRKPNKNKEKVKIETKPLEANKSFDNKTVTKLKKQSESDQNLNPKERKVSAKKNPNIMSQQAQLSGMDQSSDQIHMKDSLGQRHFDTDRPHLLQNSNKVQIVRSSDLTQSALFIPQHSVHQQSAVPPQKSVQIEDKQASQDGNNIPEDQATEMNEESHDIEADYLMELAAQEADVKTNTEYKITRREDTCREDVDNFLDKLAKRK